MESRSEGEKRSRGVTATCYCSFSLQSVLCSEESLARIGLTWVPGAGDGAIRRISGHARPKVGWGSEQYNVESRKNFSERWNQKDAQI